MSRQESQKAEIAATAFGTATEFYFMFPEVFIGGNGDIVLCQEHTSINQERYLRLIVGIDDAEKLCEAIMAAARKGRGS